jgi:hypothetical protein
MHHFIISIGGTGMRCLESFVHLCAMGMMDDCEIDILTLDTDAENGNRVRVEQLIDQYNKIKGNNTLNDGESNAGINNSTFFSAKLNKFSYYTIYNEERGTKFKQLARLATSGEREENKKLADLFLDKDRVQEFDLQRGYRAQTHLGSYLMYHSLIDSAVRISKGNSAAGDFRNRSLEKPDEDLKEFLGRLVKAENGSKVFIFGSVFGGTGASSIPILPPALRDAVSIACGGKVLNANFGATLLTNYFSFPPSNKAQKDKEKVIAESVYFDLNSQAAIDFYSKDKSVREFYKSFYMVGWPEEAAEWGAKDGTIQTGGSEQKNPCHVAELMCAAAAYDFFKKDISTNKKDVEYFYRSAPFNEGKFSFRAEDFFGPDAAKFSNRIGAMFSLANIVITSCEAKNEGGIKQLQKLMAKDGEEFKNLTNSQYKAIDDYLMQFAFEPSNGILRHGWLYQLKDSVKGQFIFDSKSFADDLAKARDVNPGLLFSELNKERNWAPKALFGGYKSVGDTVDEFIKTLRKTPTPTDQSQHLDNLMERFIARIFATFKQLQNFN